MNKIPITSQHIEALASYNLQHPTCLKISPITVCSRELVVFHLMDFLLHGS